MRNVRLEQLWSGGNQAGRDILISDSRGVTDIRKQITYVRSLQWVQVTLLIATILMHLTAFLMYQYLTQQLTKIAIQKESHIKEHQLFKAAANSNGSIISALTYYPQ